MISHVSQAVIEIGTTIFAVLCINLSIRTNQAVSAQLPDSFLVEEIRAIPTSRTPCVPAGIHHPLQKVDAFIVAAIGAADRWFFLEKSFVKHLMEILLQGLEQLLSWNSVQSDLQPTGLDAEAVPQMQIDGKDRCVPAAGAEKIARHVAPLIGRVDPSCPCHCAAPVCRQSPWPGLPGWPQSPRRPADPT